MTSDNCPYYESTLNFLFTWEIPLKLFPSQLPILTGYKFIIPDISAEKKINQISVEKAYFYN